MPGLGLKTKNIFLLINHYTIACEKNHMAFFYWPGLELVHITSTAIELTSCLSHYPTGMQNRLKNVVLHLPALFLAMTVYN